MAEVKFKDNATTKIIAFDFDNTLTDSDIFPSIGRPRKYAREVVNLLYDLGVTVLIWTCRDRDDLKIMTSDEDGTVSYTRDHDDIAPMVGWLKVNKFRYTDINTCIKYAPFHYEARKIYAHMYVDDKAFGWNDDDERILLRVLKIFMVKHMGYDVIDVLTICDRISKGMEVNVEWVKSLR